MSEVEDLLAVDDFIAKELSEFLEGLREQAMQLHPKVSKEYIEEVIDITLEESAEWEWN
jgi:hypothetical protein